MNQTGESDEGRKLARSGAFLGPDLLAVVPLRTLSDEYHDEPEPEDSNRIPAPPAPSRARRLRDWLGRLKNA